MLSRTVLQDVLREYKLDFSARWKQEKYKWEAVRIFQDSFDIDAADFASMLARSLSGTGTMLATTRCAAAHVVHMIAPKFPEEVRSMVRGLLNESADLLERIEAFRSKLLDLRARIDDSADALFQLEDTAGVYLWLCYPDKYGIYRTGEANYVSAHLKSDYQIEKSPCVSNMRSTYKLLDELAQNLKQHTDIVEMMRDRLTDSCYPDPELRTLASDLSLYISRNYSEPSGWGKHEWRPLDYDPCLSEQDWLELLNDKKVFTERSLEVMKRIKDCGGTASCVQLAQTYGLSNNFYNTNSFTLAQRVASKTGCPVRLRSDGSTRSWWTVLYLGRDTTRNEPGTYMWKLRDELSAALDKVDLSHIPLYSRNYWLVNIGSDTCRFSDIAPGELADIPVSAIPAAESPSEEPVPQIGPGDMIICCCSDPVGRIVAVGKAGSKQDSDSISVEILEKPSPVDFSSPKDDPELRELEFFRKPAIGRYSLTESTYNSIVEMLHGSTGESADTDDVSEVTVQTYTDADFLRDVYMSEERYRSLQAVLRNKKNLILQGASGVGKTFAAKRLAYSMMGRKDDSRIKLIQFHQNYSYEDFMMGYKPVQDGFVLKNGIFYEFCKQAVQKPDLEFFFIIDEINRGNMSKIFGELLMLIEREYRDTEIELAYNGEPFSVPSNLYIIGTMNTADRSLALIDYALRRRFSFFDIDPGFESEGFMRYQNGLNNKTLDELIQRVKRLNREIAHDKSLGKGFCIGHSYFCGQQTCTASWLRSVVEFDIIPMLAEYWFDDTDKLDLWEDILREPLNAAK